MIHGARGTRRVEGGQNRAFTHRQASNKATLGGWPPTPAPVVCVGGCAGRGVRPQHGSRQGSGVGVVPHELHVGVHHLLHELLRGGREVGEGPRGRPRGGIRSTFAHTLALLHHRSAGSPETRWVKSRPALPCWHLSARHALLPKMLTPAGPFPGQVSRVTGDALHCCGGCCLPSKNNSPGWPPTARLLGVPKQNSPPPPQWIALGGHEPLGRYKAHHSHQM